MLSAQLEEMKLSLDLIDGAKDHIGAIKSNFQELDGMCREGSGLLSRHPKIKKVNVARKNTQNAIEQIDFYRAIPDKVERLKRTLEGEPAKLKVVHDETAQLKRWRTTITRMSTLRSFVTCSRRRLLKMLKSSSTSSEGRGEAA